MGGEVPAADIAGASPAGLVRAFLAWAERHPEEGDEHRSVAGIALWKPFPAADLGRPEAGSWTRRTTTSPQAARVSGDRP